MAKGIRGGGGGRGRLQPREGEDMPKAKLNLANLKKSLRVFKYVGSHKWKLFLGLFFLLGTSATALVFPWLMGDLMGVIGGVGAVGQGTTSNTTISIETLTHFADTAGVKLLVLFSIQAFFSFGRVVTFTSFTEHMLAGLRREAFGKLIQMPMAFYSQRQVAELNSRMASDISQISDTFATNIAEFIRQFIIIIGGIILICYLSWKLSLLMLATVPLVAVFTLVFARYIRKLSKDLQDRIAESNVIIGESLQGIANVKSFTNEGYEINRYNNKISEILRLAVKGGIARGGFFSFIIFCLFGVIIFIVWQGIHIMLENHIAPKQILSFMFYTIFVAASMGGIAEQLASIQRAIGATERVFDIIDDNPEKIDLEFKKTERREKLNGDLDFKNVSFTYPSRPDFQVLKDVSFNVKSGETVALVGSSGSGKSTLASLALRFYELNGGEYLIDGKRSTDYSLTELRDQMAIVPQDVLLFGGSIKENILYGRPTASMEEVIEAAKKANAYDFIMSFPDKFDTIVGDRGIQLSGGQRQRVAIARAVLKNPSILILDEATSSLDSESERLVQEALDKLMEGRTSIVIAHRLSTIKKADKIVVLQKGEIKEVGTHQQLIANDQGLYHKLSKLQFEWN